MEKEYLVREIVAAIFFKRCVNGEKDISLKMEDIMEYVPKLEELFTNENFNSDLFIKTPVEETYDEFKTFIISYMLGMKFGYMNDKFDKITLSINEYFINKYLNNLSKYKEIIDKGYNLLVEEKLELKPKQIIKVKGNI